jgi:hypothetical protein
MAANRGIFASQIQLARCPQASLQGVQKDENQVQFRNVAPYGHSDFDAYRLTVRGVVYQQSRSSLFDISAFVAPCPGNNDTMINARSRPTPSSSMSASA